VGKENEMSQVQFSDHVGSQIWIMVKRIPGRLQSVKLVGVETGGLWIEHQEITNAILQSVGVPTAAKTPLVFLPYGEISLAMISVEGIVLDEKAFGV
jgi:hypothetical protein